MPMKKLARSSSLSPCKLVIHRETVRVLRQLALKELHDARGGATLPLCQDSPPPPMTVWCD
jgi:hypothetical protein